MGAALARRSAIALSACVLLASSFAFAQGQENAMRAGFNFLFQLLLLSAGCIVELVLIKVASGKGKPVLVACLVGGSALIVLGVKSALMFESWSSLSAGGIANAQLLVSVSACVIGLWGVVIALRSLAPRSG